MIADTCFLFAILVADDADHQKAVTDGQSIEGQILVPDRIFEELATALVYKKGIEFAITALAEVRSNKRLEFYQVSPEDAAGTLKLMGSVRRKISFNDYCIAYLARQRGENVLTYDRQVLGVLKGEVNAK